MPRLFLAANLVGATEGTLNAGHLQLVYDAGDGCVRLKAVKIFSYHPDA